MTLSKLVFGLIMSLNDDQRVFTVLNRAMVYEFLSQRTFMVFRWGIDDLRLKIYDKPPKI